MPQRLRHCFASAILLLSTLMLGSGMAFAQGASPGVLVFSPAIYTVSEGAGSVTVSVARTAGSSGAIGVNAATYNGTATAPADYTATSVTLAWADGDSAAKTIVIPIVQNSTPEALRTFNVLLSNATGGASIGVSNNMLSTALVRITDDEPDAFPPGGQFPAGFSSTTYPQGQVWTVEPDYGYQSATSLRSGQIFSYYDYVYDEDLGSVLALVPGYSQLSTQGDFLAGNLTFSYRLSGGSDASLSLYRDFANVQPLGIGQTDWQTVTIPVTQGPHTFAWSFSNAGLQPCALTRPAAADGMPCSDRAFVDSVVLPPKAARLAVVRVGTGVVQVSGQTDCTDNCNYYLVPGTVVTLTPIVPPGYVFSGWIGTDCTGTGPCTLTMDTAKTAIANIGPATPTLNVAYLSASTPDMGTIVSAPAGINCPTNCTADFANGTVITLTATPSAGHSFAGWSGGTCSGTGDCVITLTQSQYVYAGFTNEFPPLTIQISGAGSGTVTSNPAGIACPGNCTAPYPRLSQVTLTATPAPGSYGWFTSYCFGQQSCTVTMTGAFPVLVDFYAGSKPDAPTLTAVTPGISQLTISFAAPANNGGVAIRSYTATCGTASASAATSPIVLTNLMPGSAYSCAVTATNAAGASTASNAIVGTPYAQLVLVAAVSRKHHNGVGDFDVELNRFATVNGLVSVEPRMIGPGHQLIFSFNIDISAVGGVFASLGSATVATAGNRIIVTLSDVPDNRRVLVSLMDIAAPGNQLSLNLATGFLVGDVNSSRAVNAADILGIKARSGRTTIDNFIYDVDLSGNVDRNDLAAAKLRAGLMLPP